MTYDGQRLGPPKPVLTGIPNGFIHDGGRLLFAPDGNLFVSTGETGEEQLAQDRDSLGGKILRITPEGKARTGQPAEGLAGVDDGAPQRAGPRVRRRGPAVGDRVRREHLGRAEPHRQGPQLRVAARGGQGRRPGSTATRSCSGAPPTPHPPGSPTSTARCGRARCAAAGCGRSRSTRSGTRASRGTSSSATTAGCAPSWRRPTATSG